MLGIPLKSKLGIAEVFKISPFKEVIKPTVPHKHAGYFELIVLSDGAGEHVIDGEIHEIIPPTIFFLEPGRTHCWNFTRIPKGYVLLFKEELLEADQLATAYQLGTQINLSGDTGYLPLLELLWEEYRRSSMNTPILATYLQLVLAKTAALAQKKHNPPTNTLYYQFKSLLHNTEPGSKKVKHYAKELNISSHQLNMICREAAGKSPSTMLNERLLLEAKTLLSATKKTIKQIAHILYFTDTSHFVKFFKRATNLTPGTYRGLLAKK